MSADPIAVTAAVSIVAGIAGQVVARRMRIPAIAPLLVLGVVLGPDLLGIVDPGDLGDGLRVIVGFAVAIILFEGGLSLKTESFRLAGTAIRNLVGLGALLTWGLCAGAAALFFPELRLGPAVLFGALVIVTGPTVIQPLVASVRPRQRVADVLRGEAILIDPVGALYAVLVLEYILEAEKSGTGHVLLAFVERLLLGFFVGGGGAYLLYYLLKRQSVLARDLRNLAVLASAIGLYAVSEAAISESGVLTVTIAGFLLGWLHPPGIEEVEEFKGHMTVLMVSTVFVLLSANLSLPALRDLGWPGLAVVACTIFAVRPATVFLCTLGTDLTVRERLFLSWIAPRGIVAAAVSSLFALLLEDHGMTSGRTVMSLTFAVIVGTVLLQGPTARPIGRLLGVLQEAPNGFLIVGGNVVGRVLGRALQAVKLPVLVLDTNEWHVQQCRDSGLNARKANAIDPIVMEELDLDGIGNLIAVTPNDGVNRLAARLYSRTFGEGSALAIRMGDSPADEKREGFHYLFGERLSWERTYRLLQEGWTIERAEVDHELAVGDFDDVVPRAIPLLAFDARGRHRHLEDDGALEVGEHVLYLAPPEPEEAAAPADEARTAGAADGAGDAGERAVGAHPA